MMTMMTMIMIAKTLPRVHLLHTACPTGYVNIRLQKKSQNTYCWLMDKSCTTWDSGQKAWLHAGVEALHWERRVLGPDCLLCQCTGTTLPTSLFWELLAKCIYIILSIYIYIYYIYILYIIYFVESCVALHLSRLAENGNQLLILRLDRHTNAT